MEAAQKRATTKSEFADYDYSNFYYGAGDDPLNLLRPFMPTGIARPSRRATTSTRSRSSRRPPRASGSRTARPARSRTCQPGLLQLPRHLLPRRGQEGRHRGHPALRPRRLRLADPLRHLRDPRRARRAAGALQGQGSGDPVPDRLQRQRRLHLGADARGRQHLPRPVLARLDRGRRDPRQVEDGLLPPQQPDGPGAQAPQVQGKKLVVVEGVYSMDGDVCVLPEISRSPSATAPAS